MMPVIHNGVTIGIFYLENNLAPHAFTKERLEILKILSGQIAISLHNALLYENLEQKVADRTAEINLQKDEISRQKDEIQEERNLADKLLLNILPAKIAEELKKNKHASAHKFEKATVIFADIVGFSKISEALDPEILVAELDYYFSAFDRITTEYGIEKIKTIGDAYMAVAGVPSPGPDDAIHAVEASLAIQKFVHEEKEKRQGTNQLIFSLRIGIHTGPVVAGVVGMTKFAYDIWGETVNIAARMESAGESGKVNITGATYELFKHLYNATFRGKIQAKNIGEVEMYYVEKR
jgi:class 3 adenylate cyclase